MRASIDSISIRDRFRCCTYIHRSFLHTHAISPHCVHLLYSSTTHDFHAMLSPGHVFFFLKRVFFDEYFSCLLLVSWHVRKLCGRQIHDKLSDSVLFLSFVRYYFALFFCAQLIADLQSSPCVCSIVDDGETCVSLYFCVTWFFSMYKNSSKIFSFAKAI